MSHEIILERKKGNTLFCSLIIIYQPKRCHCHMSFVLKLNYKIKIGGSYIWFLLLQLFFFFKRRDGQNYKALFYCPGYGSNVRQYE